MKQVVVAGALVLGASAVSGCGQGVVSTGGEPGTTAGPRASTTAPAPPTTDVFTPVVGSLMGNEPQAVLATDGRAHIVYEVELTNSKAAPATLESVAVVDAASRDTIASWNGADLVDRLVSLQPAPATDAVIEPNGSRVLYVELAFDGLDDVPDRVEHHVELLGAANPGTDEPTPLGYSLAPVSFDTEPTQVLGPPLSGDRWVAANGCCLPTIVHRGSVASVNGRLYDAQRFAIDWMRLDEEGRLVHGDPTVAANYPGYGAEVLAVADARVVATLDTLDDQVPGTLPDPADITIETVDGNHVILELGDGRHVFYAHLQKGSVTVEPGDRVRRGEVLGLLGNSGNTSAPHLHIHLMDGPSALGSQGLPYAIDRFRLTGQIDQEAFAAAPGVEGVWISGPQPEPVRQRQRFPLDLNVVSFR